jgi:hypothetical protein
MMIGGKGTHAINIGRFTMYKVKQNLTIEGEIDAKTLRVPNNFQAGVGQYLQVVPRRGHCMWGWINNSHVQPDST